jgi:S1-C subfamily serine protease
MVNRQQQYYWIKAILLCSAVMFSGGHSNDLQGTQGDSVFLTTSSPSFQADCSCWQAKENGSKNLEDFLQQILDKGKIGFSTKDALIKKIEPSIPYIYKIIFQSSYSGPTLAHTGTGFLLDAQKGVIATNYHVVPGNLAGIITIVTDKGEEYTSPAVKIWQTSVGCQFGDFSLLQVEELATNNPQVQIPIAQEFDAKKHDILGFMGNSSGSFTVEVGRVNDRYYYWDSPLARGCMSVSVALGAHGGASGSPVFNENGQIVGILFAGDDVHNMILPISYVMDAYEQLKAGNRITAVSLGVPLISQNIYNLNLFHHIPIDILKKYIGAEDQEFKLMVAQPFISLSTGTIQYNDIILTVDGERIGTDQAKLNKLLKSSDNHILEVFRDGELIELTVPTITYEQSFARYIEVNNMMFCSADSHLLDRYGFPPLSALIQLEQLNGYAQVIKVHRTQVQTFNDFIHALFDAFENKKMETFLIYVKSGLEEVATDIYVDSRGSRGKTMYVTKMNEETHQWENIDYKEYVKDLTYSPNSRS